MVKTALLAPLGSWPLIKSIVFIIFYFIYWKVYPAWFNCDTASLPGVFFDMYPGPHQFDKGFESFKKCRWKIKGDDHGTLCQN